eukprot:12597037-Alexandrium_andersonii.AAC.1
MDRPLPLEVWRSTLDEDDPLDREEPLGADENNLSDTSSPGCALAVAWNEHHALQHPDSEWVNEFWGGFNRFQLITD